MKPFRDQPIITKTRLMTAVIIVAFILALAISFGTYWLLGSRRSLEEQTERNTIQSASSIDSDIELITTNFVSIFGTDDFALELTDILSENSDITRNRVILQNEIMRLASSSPMINTALVLDVGKGEVYTLFQDSIIQSRSRVIWDSEINNLKGLSILPPRPSPIRGQDEIVPMVFPIRFNYGGAVITDSNPDLIVIALLSEERIRGLLPADSILKNSNGDTISGWTALPERKDAGDGRHTEKGIFSYSYTLPFSGLKLISYVSLRSVLLDILGTATISILAAIAALLILVAIYSVMLRRYVTQPIGKLKVAVREIEKGNYSAKADFQGYDELGELRDAISRMGITIEKQIEAIKEEKDKQTKTEMRLLTEQLTPHFLYNTLECIQQEIQTGNNKASSEMTRALSMYLRTVLSYGSETISIKNEIQHEMSYIRIMNGRFRKDIAYHYAVAPEIQNEVLLKMVLQPFIENSIKHGFGIGDESIWVQQPEISVKFMVIDERLRIEISDNGKGFDEGEFLSIMHGEGSEGHIGIRNTYLRLLKFYGEENVAVAVSSIPYYLSTITIEVPVI